MRVAQRSCFYKVYQLASIAQQCVGTERGGNWQKKED